MLSQVIFDLPTSQAFYFLGTQYVVLSEWYSECVGCPIYIMTPTVTTEREGGKK